MILLDQFLPLGPIMGVIAFGFGVIIGSFLNVYIYRFHTGKSLSGHSHCLSCGGRLKWYDLFPLLSFLILRGRCRHCSCLITTRYFWVELVTGLLFMLTLLLTTDLLLVLLWWVVLSILVVITVYDLNHFVIPDALTAALVVLAGVMLGYKYFYYVADWQYIALTVLTPLLGVLFFFGLWFFSKGKWIGFGDVKLAFPLGLLVGPAAVFSFVVLSFWIGAAISLLIIAYTRWSRGKYRLHLEGRALTMKSEVPFAPFLVLSCLIILFTHFDVLEIFRF
tara:strand:+ start:1119 stop:1952 length:834 start_codon:yes stop_codon:yes gene_type:complete